MPQRRMLGGEEWCARGEDKVGSDGASPPISVLLSCPCTLPGNTVSLPSSQVKVRLISRCVAACRALADELNYSVSQVDPKKTIHVGSFRLNPDGSLEDKKVPLARSETHLTELLENVCDSMNDYALYIDPDTKEKSYKRFAPREGEGGNFPDFKHFQFDGPDGSESLKFAVRCCVNDPLRSLPSQCENIVEEYEDNIISLFVQGVGDVLDMLCGKISGHCKGSLSPHSEL
ncbi:MIR-interacting saposin-like protein precursor-like [Scleropages formosus]|uniref:MIR-interacting saposin-like protein-like n=1 Tax=Scleropages formosus TaxID=113540 RepID=A0A0P7WHK2_SCLFO|nr:MIR-interacting saposin-like protein precursor-like [Scleropages formosus]